MMLMIVVAMAMAMAKIFAFRFYISKLPINRLRGRYVNDDEDLRLSFLCIQTPDQPPLRPLCYMISSWDGHPRNAW